MDNKPGQGLFTAKEWKLIRRLNTPAKVQRWLTETPYNWERAGGTMRSFREVVRRNQAHCLEASVAGAVILEQHGYPPLLLDIESIDLLDHVIFVFQEKGRWGSIARSRDKLRSLQHFVAAAEEKSLAGAARRFGVSTQAVAKMITALERGLGVRLFDRASHGLSLTASGANIWGSEDAFHYLAGAVGRHSRRTHRSGTGKFAAAREPAAAIDSRLSHRAVQSALSERSAGA
jgi:molybdenum-dependent DNA-binding transcriptional regulator ModE